MWYEAYAEPRLREKTGDCCLNYIDNHIIPELENIRLDKLTTIGVLPVSQQAVDLMVEEHQKHPGNPYMFPSPETGGMFDPDSFRHTHDKILKTIGTEHILFHDLRYTFATLSLKNGVDVKTLSGTLGGHYSAGFNAHATPDMMREAADTMGDVLERPYKSVPVTCIQNRNWAVYWSKPRPR